MTITVLNADGDPVEIEVPPAPGRADADGSRSVALSNEDKSQLDAAVTALQALHTDLATTLAGYVDGLETLIGTSNTNLGTLHADIATTLAALITSSNSKLDTVHTDLATTIGGFVDGLETLITASNTKLDTVHTDIATTLAAYVDGLETLLGKWGTGAQTSVSSSASDGTILASNANRMGGMIFNDSTALLYLLYASGTSSSTNHSTQLQPGAVADIPQKYTGVIKGIWASANGAARVTEFTA